MITYLDFISKISKDISKGITESTQDSVIFTFGRMNPITSGHEKNVNELIKLGKEYKATPMLFLSKTEDKNKNPLSYKDKVKYAEKFFDIKVSHDDKLSNAFKILEYLAKEYKNIYFLVGEDRVADFSRMQKYADDWGVDHFQILNSGKRTKGVSGTDMRNYVKEDNFEMFKKNLPSKASESDAKELFKLLKDKLNG